MTMILREETAESVARYRALAREYRDKADECEFMHIRAQLLEVAAQWAVLADKTANAKVEMNLTQ